MKQPNRAHADRALARRRQQNARIALDHEAEERMRRALAALNLPPTTKDATA